MANRQIIDGVNVSECGYIMTDELEKQFFNTFNIEPIRCNDNKNCTGVLDCTQCPNAEYPKITDRILLELMELLMKQQATEFYYHNNEYSFSSKLLGSNRPTCNRVKNLRELVLRTANCLGGFAPLKDKMLKQVRILFEEEK